MDKTLLVLLIAPSLLFTWERASANENEEFITESGDQSKQSRPSREGRDDSKGSRGEQSIGGVRESQRQQPQIQQPQRQSQIQQPQIQQFQRQSQIQQPQIQQPQRQLQIQQPQRQPQMQQPQIQQSGKQEFPEKKSGERAWESEKKDAVKTLPDGFRDGDKDRSDYRRERISKERLKEKEIRWQSKSKEWRKNFSNKRTRDHIFDDYFWGQFRRRYNHWYFDNNFQWYSGATWPRIVVWLPWQWSRPIYYFYETDGDVYYSTTEDFSYLTPVDSKEIFIAQAVRIANARYPISKQQSDWMPLGMFTFASENASADMPARYITLAISKDGAVSGAYFDPASNTTLEIQGGIDPVSQRIAWKFVGNDWPIMESGLYNLTKEESTLLIHTSSRTTETQLLIRLDR